MIVKQLYADNALRNFHYLIACPETREALVIDPLDVERCYDAAQKQGFRITQILNTHEHSDHIDGNSEMVEKTGARILAHHGAVGTIPNIDVGLKAGDLVKVGQSVNLKVLDTPGHTKSHVCLLSTGEQAALFCGDTLFNAGAGHCRGGGNVDELYETFTRQLSALPDTTKIYPGHDYMINNLNFTIDREPGNEAAKDILQRLENQDPHKAYVTSIAQEKLINSFFRLNNPNIIKQLKKSVPDFPDNPTERQVFIALRTLRNVW